MKIIIAPDKFKGSLSSEEACKAISDGVLQIHPHATVCSLPMADGGDGFAAVMKYYLHTQTVFCSTVDPLMRPITAAYEWNAGNKTAVIEMAAASGLLLLQEEERNVVKASTYGTGLLMKDAIYRGAKKILLGLGGSATNDAGMGILAALGVEFTGATHQPLQACGENLQQVQHIVCPLPLPAVKIALACDVENPLFGSEGAAFVYAPQKGASSAEVEMLDKGLQHFAALLQSQSRKDVSRFKGAGAAGGVAAGLSAYFDTTIHPGAAIVAEAAGIEAHIKAADVVITGEGKLDGQTGKGKVVSHIAGLGKKYQVPVMAICGITEMSKEEIQAIGLSAAVSMVSSSVSKEEAMEQAGKHLTAAAAMLAAHFTNRS
jgi:glycerate kinase